jgi:hypothetical protein
VVTDDNFYMEPLANITAKWAAAAGIDPGQPPTPYMTNASTAIHCVKPHGRSSTGSSQDGGEVLIVTCSGSWDHTWPLHRTDPWAYPALLLEFFQRTPLPPRTTVPAPTTKTQATAIARLTSSATRASSAAVEEATALFDRPGLRQILRQSAPSLAAMPATQLFRMWEAQLASAEIAHGLYVREPAYQLDSLAPLNATTRWFPNQWQLALTEPRFGTDGWRLLSYYPAEGEVEVGWLGLPAFSTPNTLIAGGVPASLAEASDRPLCKITANPSSFTLAPFHAHTLLQYIFPALHCCRLANPPPPPALLLSPHSLRSQTAP